MPGTGRGPPTEARDLLQQNLRHAPERDPNHQRSGGHLHPARCRKVPSSRLALLEGSHQHLGGDVQSEGSEVCEWGVGRVALSHQQREIDDEGGDRGGESFVSDVIQVQQGGGVFDGFAAASGDH